MGEFELIQGFFDRPTPPWARESVALGVGDDCALLLPRPGMQWAVSTDMLVSGRHFFADVDPAALGHKALAVNLSDLAACGARPLAFTLALALPEANATWLEGFAQGLFALANVHQCALVGGDTTRGPLTISITVFGEVAPGQALLRSGACAGDDIWVSGHLGDAALALGALQGHWALPPEALAQARQRLERPTPRVALGQALRGVASACADVSDGLLGDLGHILQRSGVGAEIRLSDAIQLIATKDQFTRANGLCGLAPEAVRGCILAGGDDYELVFTAAPEHRAQVQAAGAQTATPVACIGRIVPGSGARVLDAAGAALALPRGGFDHFAA
ncbi:MAG: thiamine-phosphate kinase [Rhodoferax sp.]